MIDRGLVGRGGMHDEAAKHADHLLHGHVRVVEERSALVNMELVDEAAAGKHGLLRDAGLAVVADLIFKAVPVNRTWLGKMVVEDDADVVALIDLNGGPGRRAIEAPEVERPVGQNRSLHWLGDEVEDLGAVVEREGEIGDIGSGDGDIACPSAAGAGEVMNRPGGAGVRAAAGGFVGKKLRCGGEAGS